MICRHLGILLLGILFAAPINAQQDNAEKDSLQPASISVDFLDKTKERTAKMEARVEESSARALNAFQKQELNIYRKLERKDSLKAAQLLAGANQRYQQLDQQLKSKTSQFKKYIPSLDTLATSIKFLEDNPELLATAKNTSQQIKEASQKIKDLQAELQQAENIKAFIKERKEYLKQQLSQLGFAKELKRINKQAYYYSEKLKEYREILKDPNKAEKKAIELLGKTKMFKDFMRKNSELASLFRIPGADPTYPNSLASLAGLQTRSQVNSFIQQQISAGGPNGQQQLQQNLQQTQSQLNTLKNKLDQMGGGSTDDIMPEGFKPNHQKTKSFLQRMEYGVNLQSQKSNGYFPVTSDIGLSLGYKLNDKSIIGIGVSYKMGWGENIQNIKITHQGVGLRSFVDWKIKGNFWISGGYEVNYRDEINHIDELKDMSAWQQSGLIGLSKQLTLKSKFLKKTKLQLLWDFLSYRQVPRTQAVLFRIGYTF